MLISLEIMLLVYWQASKMLYIHVVNTCFYPFFASGPIITVALSLPVAIINQPMFTSDVATCEMCSMHHSGIYSSYAIEQQLYFNYICKQQL